MLRRFVAFFLLFFSALLSASPLENSQGQPSQALLDLLKSFNIPHDGTWTTIVPTTQKAWLQGKEGSKERWQFEPKPDSQPATHYTLFTQLGMVNCCQAQKNEYDYAVILGGSVQAVRNRFAFLQKEWARGVHFKKIVFLTGDRPLDSTIESSKELLDPSSSSHPFRKGWVPPPTLPRNETEMMKLVFDQLDLPPSWRTLPRIIVDTPKPLNQSRPTTVDTMRYWMSSNPLPGSTLFVMQQPFIGRTLFLASETIPSSFSFEVIGNGISFQEYRTNPKALAIVLDELAKWLFVSHGTGL